MKKVVFCLLLAMCFLNVCFANSEEIVLGEKKVLWEETFKLVLEINNSKEILDKVPEQEKLFASLYKSTKFSKVGTKNKPNSMIGKKKNNLSSPELKFNRSEMVQMANLVSQLNPYYNAEEIASIMVYMAYNVSMDIPFVFVEDELRSLASSGKPIEIIKRGLLELPNKIAR